MTDQPAISTVPVATVACVRTSRKELRRRVRRQVMLRRLRRELASGGELATVLRRPAPH